TGMAQIRSAAAAWHYHRFRCAGGAGRCGARRHDPAVVCVCVGRMGGESCGGEGAVARSAASLKPACSRTEGPPSATSCHSLNQKWPRNFEQGVKWNLGLRAGMFCLRIRSEDDEANPPEPHTGLQGEGGPGCPQE